MKTNEDLVHIYTTASVDYDYWYVASSEVVGSTTGSNPKEVRLVKIPESRVAYQVGRYQSGLNMAVDKVEWDKLVGYKLVTVK